MPPVGFPAAVLIGSRGSELALWQARHVADRIRRLGVAVDIIIIKTAGDIDQRTAFGEMPDKGVFVKEIEDALLARRIDLAVHSLKDLPTELPDGLCLAAVPERVSPLDAFISRDGQPLLEVSAGTHVATGSLRRQAQILAVRPDLR
ncbi:MAG: hydroxymethylbilane synthase, partial [bacterium]|nr:hydroxymethylbilane synthase [bacterium]